MDDNSAVTANIDCSDLSLEWLTNVQAIMFKHYAEVSSHLIEAIEEALLNRNKNQSDLKGKSIDGDSSSDEFDVMGFIDQ